ncbi:MAG: hypothetical protein ACJ762_11340 [Solirubrobacteraceae bacterium]
MLLIPTSAQADPPECPATPPPYSGTDDAAAQLNALRGDQAASCAAIVNRLEAVDAQVGDVKTGLESVGLDSAANTVQLGGSGNTVRLSEDGNTVQLADGTRGFSSSDTPLYVETTNPYTDSGLVATQQSISEAFHSDFWWLAGLAIGLFAGFLIFRVVLK